MSSNPTLPGSMAPILLEEMDAIRLMNRIDSKFLTDIKTLDSVLHKASELGYRVLEIEGQRIACYNTVYYDTPLQQTYLDHHNRRLTRQKLRIRRYVVSGITYLELKSKNNHGRTKKKRIEVDPQEFGCAALREERLDWLRDKFRYPMDALSPAVETDFSRITIANPELTERSTIDFDLKFKNLRNGGSADMGNLVIIEVKQDGNLPSALRDILLEERVKPVRMSKYCIGTAMTSPDIRSNRFKRKLMLINKMKNSL